MASGRLRISLILLCMAISHCGHRAPRLAAAVTVPVAPGASSSPAPTVVSKREEDGDGDGVPDSEDFCLTLAEDLDRCDDEDGCPEDNDKDGIADAEDDCPHKKGPRDNKGCPQPLAPGAVLWDAADDECMMLQPVPFPRGIATLAPDGQEAVEQIVACMNFHTDLLLLELRGYSDPQESAPELATERAEAVQSALVARGIDGRRLRPTRGDPSRQHRTGEGLRSVQFVVLRSLSCPAAFDDEDYY